MHSLLTVTFVLLIQNRLFQMVRDHYHLVPIIQFVIECHRIRARNRPTYPYEPLCSIILPPNRG